MYLGLVEAQRISAERKEGIELAILEGEEAEEEIDKLVGEKNLENDDQVQLVRTKTGRSVASVEGEKLGFEYAGIVPETQYSNIQLVKKVIHLHEKADRRG
jgi:hypothetical protein